MAQLNAHIPLYLKHRPQTLDKLVGQQAVTRTLTNAIENSRLTHAYLFTGPRGTGKTSSARILAKSLNCAAFDKPTPTPCLKCDSCVEIARGTSPAVLEIDAASNNSVDDARTLIERAPLVAVGGRHKVYIIDECHMLSKEAFNALLKTIEDPPPNVVFILATTEEHKVLPTIISRCQRLMFRLARMEDLAAHLRSVANQENIEIEESAIQYIARRSGGGLRDALGLLDQASLLGSPGKPVVMQELLALLGALHEDVLLSISNSILQRDGHQMLSSIAALLDEGREPAVIAQELSRHFLNLVKVSYLDDPGAVTSDMVLGSAPYIAGVAEQAPKFQRAELAIILQALDELEQTCRRTSQPAMHLEIGMISICHRRDFTIIQELEERVRSLESGSATGAGDAAQNRAAAPRTVPPPVRPPAPTQPAAAQPAPTQPAPTQPAPTQSSPAQPAPTQPAPANLAPPSAPASPPISVPTETAPDTPPGQRTEYASTPQDTQPSEGSENANEPRHYSEPEFDDTNDREPDGATYIESVAVIPDEPAPPRAVPTQSTAASAPPSKINTAGGAASGDSDDAQSETGEDLEHIWSSMLSLLQQRNLPTHSMASTHGFPLSITQQALEVGTTKELFQKGLEQRSQHLQAAAQAVTGRALAIRVRLVSPELGAPAKQKPRQASTPSQRRPAGSEDDADDVGEPGASVSSSERSSTNIGSLDSTVVGSKPQSPSSAATAAASFGANHADSTGDSATNSATNNSELSSAGQSRPNVTKASNANANENDPQVEHDSTTIKEAYKLFEGPGSRLVQKPNA